jgi:long-chain acyl-CoA synthetase
VTAGVETPAGSRLGAATLPARLLAQAETRPRDPALRVKRLGRWLEISWGEYAARVATVALGLRELGLGPGDRVAVLSENRPEWLFADLGIQSVGAVTVGVYPSEVEAGVAQVLRDSEARVVFVEDEEQLDKTLAVRGDLPRLEKIVVLDTRGIRSLLDPMTMSLDELENLGEQPARGVLELWGELVAQLRGGGDVAVVVYTSGVGAPPSGVMLSHANLSAAASILTEFFGARRDDEILSYLPLSHVAERLVSVIAAVHAGYVVNFGEGGESFANDLREVQPTFFLGVPRVWERLMGSVLFRVRNTSWLKRQVYATCQRQGARIGEARRRGRAGSRFWAAVGWLLLFRTLRQKVGLSRVRIALSGAAPIAPEVLEYWWSLGVPLRETYGQTEDTAVATAHRADDVRLGTVGPALPGVEVRVAADAEILIRSPGNFVGYLGDEAATRAVLDAEGWLHTGDLGELDADGNLRITGRKKDVIVTAGGLNVSPAKIENLAKVSPFISEAMVVGDRRPYLCALVGVESTAVAEWAKQQGLQFTTEHDLVSKPEVRRLVERQIADTNERLADAEQLRRFELLPVDLGEVGALTATQKVRRQQVVEQFADLIDGMYASGGGQ